MTSMGEILDLTTKYEAAKTAALERRDSEHARDERLQLAVAALSSALLNLSDLGEVDAGGAVVAMLAPIARWVETGEVTR